ncbi:MAG TPA: DUF3108 domain-containing protein [Blastocatellia bacterium]|nr:DUF3108 domain-containing protein [Blastocatellia bacterium]
MVKRTFIIIALLSLAMPAGLARAEDPVSASSPSDKKSGAKHPFVVGERLNYEVSWSNFVVAGELTLETKERRSFDGIDGYHVTAQAQSVGLVSLMGYKVNDTYESFINAATIKPFRAERRTRHGNKRDQSSVILDHERGSARLSDGRSIEIPEDTYDLAGLLYAVRAMDLTIGKARTLTLIEDDKLYTIRVEPEAREKVYTRAGEYNAIRISTKSLDGGKAKDPYKLKFYLTNDSRRIPVLITAEPSWGEVRVELTSATGTRKK